MNEDYATCTFTMWHDKCRAGQKLESSTNQYLSWLFLCDCNCNYVFIYQVSLAKKQRRTFPFSSQATTCPPVNHIPWRLHTVLFIAESPAGNLWIPIFIVLVFTQSGIEVESIASVADTLYPLDHWLVVLQTQQKDNNKDNEKSEIFSHGKKLCKFKQTTKHLLWYIWPSASAICRTNTKKLKWSQQFNKYRLFWTWFLSRKDWRKKTWNFTNLTYCWKTFNLEVFWGWNWLF